MKLSTVDRIWTIFEKAVDEQFFAGGVFPYRDHGLSQVLNRFWKAAMHPRQQALALLSRHTWFTNIDYRLTMAGRNARIACQPENRWFALHIIVASHTLAVIVNVDKGEIFHTSIAFNRRQLARFASLDYSLVLDDLVDQGIKACRSLDKAIADNLAQWQQKSGSTP